MPAIKKRITAEYMAEQQRNEENGNPVSSGGDAEMEEDDSHVPPKGSSPVKRKAPSSGGSGASQMKWLDGEVLVEKRKRTIPPAELKLSTWFDLNFEKKAEVHVSAKSLYTFYTDMCQQEGGGVVEVNHFNKMLRDKFGKEFGLKEGSVYAGLLKETKVNKKPANRAQSLGLKSKDLIEEAVRSSGNPTKGVRFHAIKQYIASKYPAFQVEGRLGVLRATLERGVAYGKIERVKGIGFCGFYRLPGPSDIEEEPPKDKKKDKKKKTADKEESKDEDGVENGEKTEKPASDEAKNGEDGKTTDGETPKEGDTDGAEEDKSEKKKVKRRKSKPKEKKRNLGYKDIDHSNPQRIDEVFPLALTYMAEPKETSFNKIKKYLEKYYGKSDIEDRLKKTLESGCEYGFWERVSGSGKSGSFQLLLDSFNPEHTESLTDMICSAILACSEPKTASYQLIKSYINDYHPDFNIEVRPYLLKKAITRAVQNSSLVQVSGLGMTGSFQLTDPFTPSPAILAGNDEDYFSSEEEEEEERGSGRGSSRQDEVYVVRKTKSGRRAPVERLEYHEEEKKPRPAPSSRRAAKGGKKPAPKRTVTYVETDSEEESESEEEVDSDAEKYTPRKTQSGRGRGAAPAKKTAAKAKPSKAKAKARGGSAKKAAKPPAKKRSAPKSRRAARDDSDDDDDVQIESEPDDYVARPTKSGRSPSKAGKTPPKKAKPATPKREGRLTPKKSYAEDDDDDDEEDYFEVEEAAPPKRGSLAKSTPAKTSPAKSTPAKRKGESGKADSGGRPARSASKSARLSLQESDSDEDDYVARPTSSGRGSSRR